jgi:hypothetical protein
MSPETRVPPLRWILPLAQLLLCVVILWPIRPMLVGQIRASLREYGVTHDTTERDPVTLRLIPFDLLDLEVQRRIKVSEARELTVATLNLPGFLPDVTYAILSPAHSGWIPRGMLMWTWRDLSWPIIGIFFWWLAGRSIEALLFSRRRILYPKIRLWEFVVSLPVVAFGAIWPVCLGIDHNARREFPLWMMLVVFGSMWVVLGASTPLAYVVQWRLRRRLPSGTVEGARTVTSTS